MTPEFEFLYRRDFPSYVDFSFRELHLRELMDDNWHIQFVAGLLEYLWTTKNPQVYRSHIFNLPPGSLKTHICSVALPTWILGWDPRRNVLIVSETPDHALEIRERCAELMGTKRYRSLFPHTRLVSGKKGLELSHGGGIRHAGVGYSLPSRRSDLVVIDNPQSLHSLDRFRPESFAEIDRTLKNPKDGMIVVATRRLGENDLSGFLSRRGTLQRHSSAPRNTTAGNRSKKPTTTEASRVVTWTPGPFSGGALALQTQGDGFAENGSDAPDSLLAAQGFIIGWRHHPSILSRDAFVPAPD